MRSLLKATPCLVLAALLVLALSAAAEDGVEPAPLGGQGCTPFSLDLTAPAQQEALAEATFTPTGPSEVVSLGEHLKVSSRPFEVVSPDGAVSTVRIWCAAFCPDDSEPAGCEPRPTGQCSLCGCGGAGVCTCNRIVLE